MMENENVSDNGQKMIKKKKLKIRLSIHVTHWQNLNNMDKNACVKFERQHFVLRFKIGISSKKAYFFKYFDYFLPATNYPILVFD